MLARPNLLSALTVLAWLWSSSAAVAEGILDGRVFSGMIGPTENLDLADSLHFSDGRFWSDICTRCGFRPGVYEAKSTEDGVVFQGILESDSRGRFEYDGLVHHDGSIHVAISWEKRRWYWTSSREIAFEGSEVGNPVLVTLVQLRARMDAAEPGNNPLCARF